MLPAGRFGEVSLPLEPGGRSYRIRCSKCRSDLSALAIIRAWRIRRSKETIICLNHVTFIANLPDSKYSLERGQATVRGIVKTIELAVPRHQELSAPRSLLMALSLISAFYCFPMWRNLYSVGKQR